MSASAPAPARPALGNTAETYGAVTKTFHWLTALLILTAIPLGVVAHNLPYETSEQLARKAWLFSLHKTIGVTAFLVAVARILWAVSQPKPGLLNAGRKLESFAAETVHWLLYASLLLVPLSGWIHHAASTGFAPIWWPFGQTLPLVPKSEAVSAFFAAWHFVFTKVLGAAVLLHIAGALKHHLVDRDDTLRRMLPGRTVPDLPEQSHDRRPLVAASSIWVAAIALGSVLGVAGPRETALPAGPALDAAPGDWVVQAGTLGITVRQLNAPVEGRFADWTAAIAFDPDAEGPVMGDVEVQVAIGSLTLGSVTSEAVKPEFLAAEAHPTAIFAADILRDEDGDGYVADGTLTLKGQSAPVSLPFDLTLDGDTAQMAGSLTLDRRTFGVGTTQYDDEATVAFDVAVDVSLTATRRAE